MLVLRRKLGEKIDIGSDIQIVLLAIGTTNVDIGIIAPGDVHIRRSELPPKDVAAAGASGKTGDAV